MIALDTNILVRLITRDDEKQYAQAVQAIEEALEAAEVILISDVVVCELLWVLGRAFSVPRNKLLDLVEGLLNRDGFLLESRESIEDALTECQAGKGDFADYLIAAKTRRLGARHLITFDAAHKKDPAFRVLRGG